jgi:hypothetical protein
LVDIKQDKLSGPNGDINTVYSKDAVEEILHDAETGSITQQTWSMLDSGFLTTAGVVAGIKSQRATVYTTWNNDNVTTQVALTTATQQ